jgi:hypothetical protein
MTAFYHSRKPPGTIGAARKHVIPFRKYDHTKAQPLSRAGKQQRELLEVAAMASALCANAAREAARCELSGGGVTEADRRPGGRARAGADRCRTT